VCIQLSIDFICELVSVGVLYFVGELSVGHLSFNGLSCRRVLHCRWKRCRRVVVRRDVFRWPLIDSSVLVSCLYLPVTLFRLWKDSLICVIHFFYGYHWLILVNLNQMCPQVLLFDYFLYVKFYLCLQFLVCGRHKTFFYMYKVN
jgi:hypothetical protein